MLTKILSFTIIIALLVSLITAAIYFDLINKTLPLEKHLASIEQRISIVTPSTPRDKYPVVLLFHGCGGVLNHQDYWANIINSIGFIAVIVDSYKARTLDPKAVCSGYNFRGSHRSADILSALAYIKTQKNIDLSNIYLAGWSHGAWAAMDAIALLSDQEPAPGMQKLHKGLSIADIAGSILFYPYCNKWISESAKRPWSGNFKSLFIFGENDKKINIQACKDIIIDKQIKHSIHIFDNAKHAFDYPENLTHLRIYSNPEARDKSVIIVKNFLKEQLSKEFGSL